MITNIIQNVDSKFVRTQTHMGIRRIFLCTVFNINNEKTYYIKHKPPEFYAMARTTFESCDPTQILEFCEGAI